MTNSRMTDPDVKESAKAHDAKIREWIDALRAEGIKAAHPDDGHINLHDREVHFASSYYNDNVKIGDRVVLGAPDARQRLVRLVGVRNNPFSSWDSTYWKFEILDEDFSLAA